MDRASQIERRHTGADLVPASVPVRSISTVIEVVAGLACRFLPKCAPKHFVTLGSFCLPLGLSWLPLTDVRSTHEGSTLGPMLVFSAASFIAAAFAWLPSSPSRSAPPK
ncbi:MULTISPECIES: hypothetical protein [Streptomyces]|uniref:hypothetical protein n=1 Tax=Streptomyces TaxID=1883 RepID=UPI001180F838|nr:MULTISPECIES: hypothetical protein [unclassified Streptomyces]WTE24993.1 hypothetical protein OHB50_04950 [Streptomyces anulatus]